MSVNLSKQKTNKLWKNHKNKHYIQAQEVHSAQEIIQSFHWINVISGPQKVMEISIVVIQFMLSFIR